MFRFTSRTLAAAAFIAAASLVVVAAASAAWQTYNAHGVLGAFSQPHLSCTRSGNQLQFIVSDPDVGARASGVTYNSDGSYTTSVGTGGPQEWVYYQATLYRLSVSGRWDLVAQGPWWKTFTGPWKPNVFTYSDWYNLALQRWDYDIAIPDGTGAVHVMVGGPTVFTNLQLGPRYAISLEYYWDRTADYDAAWAYSWESNVC